MSSKILVADHRDSSLNHLGDVLKARGHQVQLLRSGREALKAAKQNPPDLCIIDPMISGIDGFTLSQRLRKLYPRLPIVISTAIYKGDKYHRDAKTKYGVSAYLEKPYSDEELLRTVGSLLPFDPFQSNIVDMPPPPPLPEQEAEPAPSASDSGAFGSAAVFDDWSDSYQVIPLDGGLDTANINSAPLDTPSPEPAPPATESQLTSEDIFGSVIEEIESGGPSSVPSQPAEKAWQAPEPEFAVEDDPLDNSDSYLDKTLDVALGDHRDQIPPPPDPRANQDGPGTVLRGEQPGAAAYQLVQLVEQDELFQSWKAERTDDSGPNRFVTIKKISETTGSDDFIPLFVYEARALSHLTHANLEHILEVAKSEDTYYLVTEFLPLFNLATLYRTCSQMDYPAPPAIVTHIGLVLSKALHYAHQKKGADGNPLKIAHRSITPRNVVVSPVGEIKLIHFDLTGKGTLPNEMPDKLRYRAPEQMAGLPGDARSDIFSLGAVLFEGLAGRALFPGSSSAAIIASRQAPLPELLQINPDIPQDLAAIVTKALATNPDHRYADMHAFSYALILWNEVHKAHVDATDLMAYISAVSRGDKARLATFTTPAVVLQPPPQAAPHPLRQATPQPSAPPPRRVRPPVQVVATPAKSGGFKVILAALTVIALLASLAWAYFHFQFQPTANNDPPAAAFRQEPAALPPEVVPQRPASAEEDIPVEVTTDPESPPMVTPPEPDTSQPPVSQQVPASEEELTNEERELERIREEYRKKKEMLEKLKEKEQ